MFSFTRKPYFVVFTMMYVGSVIYLYKTGFPTVQLLAALFSYALVLPLLAYFVSLKSRKAVSSQAFYYKEWITLAALIVYIILYIAFIDRVTGEAVNRSFEGSKRTLYLIHGLKEVFFYFLIPFLIYRGVYRFTLQEAGLNIPRNHFFTRANILTFVVLGAAILVLQYYLDERLEPIWEGEYQPATLYVAIPLLFLFLLFKAGLAYGFFFRSLIQSRFAIGLNSKFGGMLVSLLVFGLGHFILFMKDGVPDRHGIEVFPGTLSAVAISIAIVSISTLFIAIIWRRSKNLWLVMALYAMLELLPNLHQFINTWM